MRSQRTFVVNRPLSEARESMLGAWAVSLVPLGLGPHGHGEDGCNYRGDYRSGWVYLCCVVFFPIGLLALLASKRQEIINVELTEEAGTTRVEATGDARRKVWRRVEDWQ